MTYVAQGCVTGKFSIQTLKKNQLAADGWN